MTKLIRLKNAITNEVGGPSLEQIIGIAIALLVGAALFAFAAKMNGWIGKAGGTVDNMQIADIPKGT